MAAIKGMMQDVLAKLTTLQVSNQDNQIVPLYTRVWNNQSGLEKNGEYVSYPKPAAFVEIVTNAAWEILGEGYRKADLGVRIHLVHEYFNADGTFEQDLNIFDLRDAVIKLLHLYSPVGCGPLTAVGEEQDFEHTNIYHYIITFLCAFVDDAGNVIQDLYIKEPPTNLELNDKAYVITLP